jgi:hypothetical protein
MSRSRRKTPITGMTTSKSEKEEKRWHNRVWRRKVRQAIHRGDDILPDKDEIMTTWEMAKDGKQHFNPRKHPDLMRK